MRVLILGAGGMLARDLVDRAPQDVEIIAKPRRDLDVTDARGVRAAVQESSPHVIINCAAYTNVDGAESERDRALAVNGEAPGIIGGAAAALDPVTACSPLVVHFSTDYVFNGRGSVPYREDHPPDPIGVYGRSKHAGEKSLAESGARYLILRTSWLFGMHGRSFPRTMWQRALEGRPTRVVSDQTGRPTYTVDLASAVWELVSGEGCHAPLTDCVLHIANAGIATWYDVAARVFAAVAARDVLKPCTTAEYPTPARRPAYSVLDTSKYQALRGGPLPRWQDAIDQFLAELRTAVSSTT